jgi:multidrug efflux pump subunit AcrA (membrane-fusion protein)
MRTFERGTGSRAAGRNRGGILISLLLALAVLAGLGWGGYRAWQSNAEAELAPDLIVDQVTRGSFDHIVLEQGELESSKNVDVLCEVRARSGGAGTPILWVVPEGTAVKKGEKLVELDGSALKTALRDKKIVVIGAEAQVAAAQAAVEQAKITRQEYLEGLYQTEERTIQSEMAVAQQGLRKAQLELQSTERLVARGLVKSLQLEADQFAVANNQNQLESAENRLRVLQNLTKQKMLVELDSKINAAEAQLAAAVGSLEEEQTDLKDIESQIELCTIYAPSDGVVTHANVYSSRGGSAEVVIEAGTVVRERQTLVRLPDPKLMQARAKVNESRVTLIDQGMPAKIRVDAIPGMELLGRVIRVNRYAEPGSWFSTSVKEYATIIEIIDPPPTIRTGMTAEAQIFVKQIPNALQVPIQAIYEHGGLTYSLVQKGDKFETRPVKIVATNEKRAAIEEGLQENETVVLNLRQNIALMKLPDLKPSEEDSMLAKRVSDAAGPLPESPGPRGGVGPGGPGGPGGPAAAGGRPGGGRPGGAGGPGAAGGGRPGGFGGPGAAGGGGGRPEGAGPPAGGGRPGGPAGGPPAQRPGTAAQASQEAGAESSAATAGTEGKKRSFLDRISDVRQGEEKSSE